MSQRPHYEIEGWLRHRTGFWSGRPREFNGRVVQLGAHKDGTDTVIRLAFPWACDHETKLESDRWGWLAKASEEVKASWDSVAAATETASSKGLGDWNLTSYRAYLTRGECRLVDYEGEYEDVAFASPFDSVAAPVRIGLSAESLRDAAGKSVVLCGRVERCKDGLWMGGDNVRVLLSPSEDRPGPATWTAEVTGTLKHVADRHYYQSINDRLPPGSPEYQDKGSGWVPDTYELLK